MVATIQRSFNASWTARPSTNWLSGFLPGDYVVFMYRSSSSKTLTSITGLGATWSIVQTGLSCIAIGTNPQNGSDGVITDNVPQTDTGGGCVVWHVRGGSPTVQSVESISQSISVVGDPVSGSLVFLGPDQVMLSCGLNNLTMHANSTPAPASWVNGTSQTSVNGWGVAPGVQRNVKQVMTRASTGVVSWGSVIVGNLTPTSGTVVKRFYLPSSAGPGGVNGSPVSPPSSTMWPSSSPTRLKLTEAPSDTPDANRTVTENVAGGAFVSPNYQYVSDPLPASWSIESVRLVQHMSNGTTGNTATLAARIALVSQDGLTVRRELYKGHGGAPASSPLNESLAREIGGKVLPATTQAGDRLVVESGAYFHNSVSTTVGGSLRHGDPAALNDAVVGSATIGRAYVEIVYATGAAPSPVLTTTRYYPEDSVQLVNGVPVLLENWERGGNALYIYEFKTQYTPDVPAWVYCQGDGTLQDSGQSRQIVAFATPAMAAGTYLGEIVLALQGSYLSSPVPGAWEFSVRLMSSAYAHKQTLVVPNASQSPWRSYSYNMGIVMKGVLPEFQAASGDRLVVEWGGRTGVATWNGLAWRNGADNPVPLSDIDGGSFEGHNWVDISLASAVTAPKIHVGSVQSTSLYLGSTKIAKAYLGSAQV